MVLAIILLGCGMLAKLFDHWFTRLQQPKTAAAEDCSSSRQQQQAAEDSSSRRQQQQQQHSRRLQQQPQQKTAAAAEDCSGSRSSRRMQQQKNAAATANPNVILRIATTPLTCSPPPNRRFRLKSLRLKLVTVFYCYKIVRSYKYGLIFGVCSSPCLPLGALLAALLLTEVPLSSSASASSE